MSPAASSYDAIPYFGQPRPQTHPDRLGTIGTILGLDPAPATRCRVLELGCGDGMNLLTLADALPGSEFIGVDTASTAIERGLALARAAGLANLALHHCDVRDVTGAWGLFDYIIAHGLYSWVAPEVRDAILSACVQLLAPGGIALVSYNAHPGGHIRTLFREMMLMQAYQFTDPAERVDQALTLLRVVSAGAPPGSVYKALVDQELERVEGYAAPYLCHDDLGEINQSFYVSEFASRAGQYGLQYLADADFFETQHTGYPDAVRAVLESLAGQGLVIEREQLLDFVKGRRFRHTLLCHAGRMLDRQPRPDLVPRFFISTPLRGCPVIDADGWVRTARGARQISAGDAEASATLAAIRESWPRCLTFGELVADVQSRLGTEPDEARVQGVVWEAFCAGVATLHSSRPPIAVEPGERPLASRLVRVQARQAAAVTTWRHMVVEIQDELGRAILALCDGSRDRRSLADEVAAREASSTDEVAVAFVRATSEDRLATLDGRLRGLALAGVLRLPE